MLMSMIIISSGGGGGGSGRSGGKAKKISDLCTIIPGTSKFPGQIGKNDNNFHIEDFQTSIIHIVTGLFKKYINDYVIKK